MNSKTSQCEVHILGIIRWSLIQALHFWAQIKVYVRGLELFGKLDAQTIESLFGNLNEVIQVNDGLEDELKLLRDERGIHLYIHFLVTVMLVTLACWWHEYVDDLMTATDVRCWTFRVLNRSSTPWNGHQQLKVVTNTIRLQHSSPTTV